MAVAWQSRMQPTVAKSTCEAEYIAAAAAIFEALALRKLVMELHTSIRVMPLLCDNNGALAVLKKPIGMPRTKHIDVAYHFPRERVLRGEISMPYIASADSADNVADFLTKHLPAVKFSWCREHAGVRITP
eukprot:365665-Chlamydomonas_euryale.AAC.24